MAELSNPAGIDEPFLDTPPLTGASRPTCQTMILGFVFLLNFTAYDTIQVYAQKLYAKSLGTDMTMVIYVFFTLGCFMSPAFVARIGARLSMLFGILGYTSVVIAGLIYFLSDGFADWLVLTAAALLGLGAALLWTGQGQFLLQIASDENRGRLFALFWALYRWASIIGGVLSFTYFSVAGNDSNSSTLYIIFLALMLCAAASTFFLQKTPPDRSVALRPSCALLEALSTTEMLCFAMLFWSTGANEPYVLSTFTRYFDKTATGAEMIVFYSGCVLGASAMGMFLDCLAARDYGCGVSILAILAFCPLHFGGFLLAAIVETDPDWPLGMSLDNPKMVIPTVAFAMWGFSDAMINTYLYWRIGRTQADSISTARAVGLFKALNSAGHILSYSLAPVNRVPGSVQLLLNVIYFTVGVVIALGRVLYRLNKLRLTRQE